MSLIDQHGRTINYLRLSVTDRCNMRCSYCMPAAGVPKLEHADILSYEQLLQLARAAVAIGIEKIRVTGGEPLVRKGILGFLKQLSAIPGLRQLVLTTNGQLLEGLALELRQAGVERVNISLDSLRPQVFARVTRRGDLARVLSGIAAAEAAGLSIKLNMVVMRGINDAELADFAALTLQKAFAVRFIEYMPAIQERNWQALVVPGQEILDRLAGKFSFTPLLRGELAGPAREFQIVGARGQIGIITALSGHFCGDCNRIRVTASGQLRHCLFAEDACDLRPLLAAGDHAALQEALRQQVVGKPAGHAMTEQAAGHGPFSMAQIGG